MRYTLALTGDSGSTEATTVYSSFTVDLRKVVPICWKRDLLTLKTSFSTESCGAVELDLIEVGLNLPTSFNKSYPEKNYVRVGIAEPVATLHENAADAQFKYRYSERDCIPVQIDYPDIAQIVVTLTSSEGIPANTLFYLTLAFEI